jgi:hypothetical protein
MGPVVAPKIQGTAHLHEAFMRQDAAKPFYGLLGKDTAGRWFQNFQEWKGPHWLMSPYAIWLAKDGELVSFRFPSRYCTMGVFHIYSFFFLVDVENTHGATQISPISAISAAKGCQHLRARLWWTCQLRQSEAGSRWGNSTLLLRWPPPSKTDKNTMQRLVP